MSVRMKFFLVMASFIAVMCVVFAVTAQFVVRDMLTVMVNEAGKSKTEAIAASLLQMYDLNGRTWEGLERAEASKLLEPGDTEAGIKVIATDHKEIFAAGSSNAPTFNYFHIKTAIQSGDATIAWLYYTDSDIAFVAKLRIGILDMLNILLIAGAIIFIVLASVVAYWLSKRLTLPLHSLIDAIDRLGKGGAGTVANVSSKDEYGKVAFAFNQMSSDIKQAEDNRKRLVADIAHELRTPLTIVQGKLDLIQQQGQTIEPQALLPLQDELIRITRLIDDLHQLSLAEARKLPVHKKVVAIDQLLQRTIERIKPDAEQNAVRLAWRCDADRTEVVVDPNRMAQVFVNLLVNAIRYTDKGGTVTIAVSEEKGKSKELDRLLITIEDTGIGISEEHLPFLFERFYRTDEARSRSEGGMGLGLAIAKQFVIANGGTIEADSKIGVGTSFRIRLPYASPRPSTDIYLSIDK
ncbi:sensor histidine kinase [Paenibacillus harenae]|uniref:histidine kinase n=1 Tax=Paenibacillus harenae TaxID=306543 RepID=A0ABT9U6T4_PAEHA|nr:ATP-binding protein [Paenibacillus harenae]MDQ0115351.1 two-component system sensor histidine kinase BaeS [Paenibacillus harenae]